MGHLSKEEKRQLIDNLEAVADDMVNYVTNMNHVRELIGLIKQVSKDYNMPRESWVWGWIYMFTRERGHEIDKLAATINTQCGSSETLVRGIIRFLSDGGWESTSANTNLIYAIVSKLPNYSEEVRGALSVGNIRRLAVLFMIKSEASLAVKEMSQQQLLDDEDSFDHDGIIEDKFAEEQKTARERELASLSQTRSIVQRNLDRQKEIDQAQIERDARNDERAEAINKLKLGSDFHKRLLRIYDRQSHVIEVATQENIELAKAVEDDLKKYVDGANEPEEAKALAKKLKPIRKDAMKAIKGKLDHLLRQQARSYKENKDKPEVKGELCAAASVAQDAKYSAEKDVREVKALKLNQSQFNAVATLFGASSMAKLEKETATKSHVPVAPKV